MRGSSNTKSLRLETEQKSSRPEAKSLTLRLMMILFTERQFKVTSEQQSIGVDSYIGFASIKLFPRFRPLADASEIRKLWIEMQSLELRNQF
jgi:hypothetical protein